MTLLTSIGEFNVLELMADDILLMAGGLFGMEEESILFIVWFGVFGGGSHEIKAAETASPAMQKVA